MEKKFINVSLDAQTGAGLELALKNTIAGTKKHIYASDIVRPAINGFIASAAAGKGAEYISALSKIPE